MFDENEKARAEAILKQLEGLSIASAASLLDRVKMLLSEVRVDMGSMHL